MLDVTRIRYFQAVAEAGSFSRAAKRLGVSQPTLSIQVARLEDEIGTPLFRRHHSGVTLSEVGQRLLGQSKDLFDHLAAMERSVRAEVEVPTGDLRVGTINSVGIYVLPEALSLFTQRFPRVRLTIRFEHSDTVLDLLHAGEIDLAITARAKPPTRAHDIMVMDDPLVLVCGRGHRLWRRRNVRARDLQDEKLVTFDNHSPTATVVESVLARHEVRMQTFIQTPQIAALIRMVRMNMGLAFIPQMALLDEIDSGGLHPLSFASDDLHRGIWLSWKSPDEFTARQAFIDCVTAVAEEKSRVRRL
jgi:LysR family hydrogen peroxide-inducible transcriptional activator